MVWTSDKPTVPGWYWYRAHVTDGALVMVRVEPDYDLAGPWGDGSASLLSDMTGQWAGPSGFAIAESLESGLHVS